ncbi:MAG TPA: HDOD domain-containing protein [Candidatus Kapabacteria bacterium]|nr:HDOD domain-containing protein [Candidatus Kapabacteria bacterium]
MNVLADVSRVKPCDQATIIERVKGCTRLPSLRSIETALKELLHADNRFTTQISEVIRRDPSLTARLLRLVNSVYYGLNSPVNSIEEAVFYLGVRQIRQLAIVTPVIEDFQKLAGGSAFQWREFWQHCIATAILTRELTSSIMRLDDESDYVAGLVHDVGRIVMASSFQDHFNAIYLEDHFDPEETLLDRERRILGVDHTELGAIYLSQHQLPPVLVEVARYHHHPERSTKARELAAAVHIADMLARYAHIGGSGNNTVVDDESWLNTKAWRILYPTTSPTDQQIAQASLKRTLERLPHILEGLV